VWIQIKPDMLLFADIPRESEIGSRSPHHVTVPLSTRLTRHTIELLNETHKPHRIQSNNSMTLPYPATSKPLLLDNITRNWFTKRRSQPDHIRQSATTINDPSNGTTFTESRTLTYSSDSPGTLGQSPSTPHPLVAPQFPKANQRNTPTSKSQTSHQATQDHSERQHRPNTPRQPDVRPKQPIHQQQIQPPQYTKPGFSELKPKGHSSGSFLFRNMNQSNRADDGWSLHDSSQASGLAAEPVRSNQKHLTRNPQMKTSIELADGSRFEHPVTQTLQNNGFITQPIMTPSTTSSLYYQPYYYHYHHGKLTKILNCSQFIKTPVSIKGKVCTYIMSSACLL